jgi:hypothetical protein
MFNNTNYKHATHKIIPSSGIYLYSVILSVLDPRKCEYLKDYLLDFEHAYMDSGGEHF